MTHPVVNIDRSRFGRTLAGLRALIERVSHTSTRWVEQLSARRGMFAAALLVGVIAALLAVFISFPGTILYHPLFGSRISDTLRLSHDIFDRDLQEDILAYRIVVPLLSGWTGTNRPWLLVVVFQWATIVLALAISFLAIARKMGKDGVRFAWPLTLALGLSFFTFWSYYGSGSFDAVTQLTLALALLISRPWPLALLALVGTLNDERFLIAAPFIVLWHAQGTRIRELVRSTWPRIAALLLALGKLPWRVGPKDRARGVRPDPYRVWLSEVMLQQTTVAAVKPYFDAFVVKWPTVTALAAAPREEILKAWAGLGYYARARNLKACAEVVAAKYGGVFPDTIDGLRALPGIGDYTAAAIAAIAFDVPAAVVDANIERVIARLFAIDTPLPAAKTAIREKQAHLTPARRPGDYAQAMMDLGSAICTPKKPACSLCPLAAPCVARAEGRQEDYPVRAEKAERPTRRGAAFVAVRADGSVLLRARPDSGLLGGMTEPPGTPWEERATPSAAGAPFPADWRDAGTVVHVFTHFRLELTVYCARVGRVKKPHQDTGGRSPTQSPAKLSPAS